MMYPLIMPGAIVQVDEQRKKITPPGSWSSEIERPIYFLETRTGFACCWCTRVREGNIILHPHPLSGVPSRVLRLGEEVEIIGQVVGIAMRLKTSFRSG